VYFGAVRPSAASFCTCRPPLQLVAAVRGDIALTTSKDVLEAVAGGTGPAKLLVTWAIRDGAVAARASVGQRWLTVDAQPTIIFDTPAEARQSAALRLLGIDPAQLSAQAGHALRGARRAGPLPVLALPRR